MPPSETRKLHPNPRPGSTHRTPRGPLPASPLLTASVKAPAYSSCVQTCVVLFDWWLERVEGDDGEIRVAGFTTRNRAARVFTSNSITMRHADGTLETADGVIVLIMGPLNVSRMHQNGFTHEVYKSLDIHDKAKQSSVCMPVSPGPKRTISVCNVGSGHQNDAHNVGSPVAGIIAAVKLQSHNSRRKGRGSKSKPKKRAGRSR